jgi:1,4-dihydroxy-6-naphthoate synthase
VGPLLISDTPNELSDEEINQASVALPGAHTTANLLFSLAYPEAKNKRFMVFSAIEEALLNKETDLGVIIHENRFTYQERGLHKVMDLGEFWEKKMNLPLPLGGIAVNQSIKRSVALKINELIHKSLASAFAQYPEITGYVKEHSQEMSEDIMRRHIDLYVNDYSLDLGEEGRLAIENLYQVFLEINNQEADDEDILFV